MESLRVDNLLSGPKNPGRVRRMSLLCNRTKRITVNQSSKQTYAMSNAQQNYKNTLLRLRSNVLEK